MVCAAVVTPISEVVWARYVPDRPYQPPCGAARPAPPPPASPPPGSTEIVAQNSRKCVASREGTITLGAQTYQVPCRTSTGSNWFLRPTGGAVSGRGPYQVINADSGMCLESADADRKVGAASRATQRPCAGVVGQAWEFIPTSAGEVTTIGKFVNSRLGDCLDINQNAISDDTPVVRWQCGSSGNQLFEVQTAALLW